MMLQAMDIPGMTAWPNWSRWKGEMIRMVSDEDAARLVVSAINSGTGVIADAGNEPHLLISGAATTDNSGASVQVDAAPIGLVQNRCVRFLTKVEMSDATQSDLFAGLFTIDTDITDGVTNGVYVRKSDDATLLELVNERATVETAVSLKSDMASATKYVLALEIHPKSATTGDIFAHVDGTYAGRLLDVALPMQGDGVMSIGVAHISGNNVGTKTCKVFGLGWAQEVA